MSELDGPIGDGDHGANLARGMAAAIKVIKSTEPQSAAEVFKAVSIALISKVSGASVRSTLWICLYGHDEG